MALEAADIVAAAADALLAILGAPEHLADGLSEGLLVVGIDIEGVGAARLLETGARAGHHGQTAADGLDDGNAKTLVARGIDKGLGVGVEGGEIVVGDVVTDLDAVAQAVGLSVSGDGVGIGGVATDDDQSEVGGEKGECLDGQKDVLAGLDGADA